MKSPKSIIIATGLMALALRPCSADSDSQVQDETFRPCAALQAFDPNYDAALSRAKKSGKPLFLLFTGSDWCGYCQRLAQEVLVKDGFTALATNAYELVVLDLPQDENAITEMQLWQNRKLYHKFARGGGVPTIVLVSPDEKVLHRSGGFMSSSGSPEKWFAKFKAEAEKSMREEGQSEKTEMTIPQGLKTLYLDKFAEKMTLVDIPEGVERIERKSSGYKPGGYVVETIRIPASVKYIYPHSFLGFGSEVEKIETASGSPYVVTNGFLIDTRDSSLVFALSENAKIEVPPCVKSIRDHAFEGNNALEVKLPEGLEKIGNESFTHCLFLRRIYIPSTVRQIGNGAFNYCGKLRSIDVSVVNKRYRAGDGFLIDIETDSLLKAFGDGKIMEIPMGVRRIGECAFASLKSLEVVKIPNTVERVGGDAFGWCDNLIRIEVPTEDVRWQILEKISDCQSDDGEGEHKTKIGVSGSPKLLPSQVLVAGGGASISPSANRAFSYYRFCIDRTKYPTDCMQLSEFEMLDADGKVIPSEKFELVFDDSGDDDDFGDGEKPECAVDGNLDTKWLDFRADHDADLERRARVWIQFKFAEPTKLSGYRWYTANDSDDRDPRAWRLLGSDDGDNWVVVDKVEDFEATSDRKKLAFTAHL